MPTPQTVLIVDDDPVMRAVLDRSVGAEYTVETAPDGRAALTRVRAGGVDLGVADLRMPEVDGFAFTEALREDELACRSLGINPTNTKLTAFAIGAMFGGVGGTLLAARQGFISPESFTFIESAIILSIVVLGGMGSQIGVVVGAILLIGIPEWFRELQEFRMLAFGGAMVLIMLWRPRGLLAHREPTVRLGEKGRPSCPKQARRRFCKWNI